jgi:hypothetical protein
MSKDTALTGRLRRGLLNARLRSAVCEFSRSRLTAPVTFSDRRSKRVRRDSQRFSRPILRRMRRVKENATFQPQFDMPRRHVPYYTTSIALLGVALTLVPLLIKHMSQTHFTSCRWRHGRHGPGASGRHICDPSYAHSNQQRANGAVGVADQAEGRSGFILLSGLVAEIYFVEYCHGLMCDLFSDQISGDALKTARKRLRDRAMRNELF